MEQPNKKPDGGRQLPLGKIRRCVDCGFLHRRDLNTLWARMQHGQSPTTEEESQEHEIFLGDREKLRYRRFRDVTSVACYRHLPIYEVEAEEPMRQDELERRIYQGLLARRDCAYYFSYVPGYTPRDHLLMQEQRWRIVEQRRWNLKYLALLAVVSLGSLITGMLSRPFWDSLLGR